MSADGNIDCVPFRSCTGDDEMPYVRQFLDEAAARQRPLMGEDCPRCGHLMALHSWGRGCIGCRLEPTE